MIRPDEHLQPIRSGKALARSLHIACRNPGYIAPLSEWLRCRSMAQKSKSYAYFDGHANSNFNPNPNKYNHPYPHSNEYLHRNNYLN